VLKLLAFVLPLGLDSFAVAATIGAIQAANARQRLRISLIFVLFEGGMPLIGLGLGTALARGIGQVAYRTGRGNRPDPAWRLSHHRADGPVSDARSLAPQRGKVRALATKRSCTD
jgi:hypothetical protein